MIVLYAWNTPNCYKVAATLGELALPFEITPVNVRKGENSSPEYMAKNPNAKVPMIEEPETKFTLTESSAILMHLAERKKRLLPESGPARWDVIRWLFFQASSVGPTLGEAAHYSFLAPEKIPYAIQRYGKEWERIAGLLEKQLASKPFLVDELTIADLAHFGWLEFVRNRGMDTKAWPSVTAWLDRIAGRPGVQEGVNRLKALEPKMR